MERWQRWVRGVVIVAFGAMAVAGYAQENIAFAAAYGFMALLWIAATWWEYTHGEWYGGSGTTRN